MVSASPEAPAVATHVVVVAGGDLPDVRGVLAALDVVLCALDWNETSALTIAREAGLDPIGWRSHRGLLAAEFADRVASVRILDPEGLSEVIERRADGIVLTVVEQISGREEIESALTRLGGQGVRPASLTEARFAESLLLADLPDPDLVIVVGSAPHIPDLFLWQMAYAELVFLDLPFSRLSTADIDAALDAFRHRDRRYGGLLSAGGSR